MTAYNSHGAIAVKKTIIILLALLILFLCTGCSGIRTPEAAEGSRIGVLKGSSSERYAALHGTVKTYESVDELTAALKAGSVDCILTDLNQMKAVRRGHPGIRRVKQPLAESYFRLAAALENPDLMDRVNAALAALKADGTLDAIIQGHYRDPDYVYEVQLPEDSDRTISAIVCRDFPPYSYTDASGNPCGIDADVIRAVCAWLGVGCELTAADGSELIAAVKNGTYQLAAGGITASSEQADLCAMSDPYAICTQILLVR